ncbi:cache domain-containing sensor histidine kinase [Paenibacillus cymbidii]|uniref:cache domain-containing sensor histidine kinase n=1 Tax=Paenibacillus cymbidii TaxID=1639034 RepID=UPI001436CA18|nr:sensor histidine kinase [Paenibacillus cymbidii]
MSVKIKLFLVNLFIVTVLLSAITYVLVTRSTRIILAQVKTNAAVTLSQLSQNLDRKLASYEEIAYALYLNVGLQETMLAEYGDYREAYDAYFRVIKPYISVLQTTKSIQRIAFYTPNRSFTFSGIALIDDSVRAPGGWYEQLKRSATGSYWMDAGRDQWTGEQLFSLKQKLNYADPASDLSASLDIDKQVLYDLVNQESKGKRITVSLPDGDILIDSGAPNGEPARLGDYPYYDRLMADSAQPSGEFSLRIGDESYFVFHSTLGSRNVARGIRIVMMVPVSDLLPEIERTRNWAIVLLVAACLLSSVAIYAITFGLMRRLTELSRKMRTIRSDNFQSYVTIRGNDEISHMGITFNRMVQQLDELFHEVYESKLKRRELELRTKEAELYALQTQINPHFLFNVFNTVQGNLLERGDTANARFVNLIARSFRLMLKKRKPVVTLREECELTLNYLHIQKYRFGDRLHIAFDMPETLLDTPLPSMSLQPLVENVINHVTEMRKGPTRITASFEREGERVRIRVCDDGPGIAPERQAEIALLLAEEPFETGAQHFGLQNVHRRLLAMFGPECGLSVTSGPGGTTVAFAVPSAGPAADLSSEQAPKGGSELV